VIDSECHFFIESVVWRRDCKKPQTLGHANRDKQWTMSFARPRAVRSIRSIFNKYNPNRHHSEIGRQAAAEKSWEKSKPHSGWRGNTDLIVPGSVTDAREAIFEGKKTGAT